MERRDLQKQTNRGPSTIRPGNELRRVPIILLRDFIEQIESNPNKDRFLRAIISPQFETVADGYNRLHSTGERFPPERAKTMHGFECLQNKQCN
jgi:hypothetical protein